MSERTLSELANAEIVPDMGGPNAWLVRFGEGDYDTVNKSGKHTLLLKKDVAIEDTATHGEVTVDYSLDTDDITLRRDGDEVRVPDNKHEGVLWAVYDEDGPRLERIFESLHVPTVRQGLMDMLMPRFRTDASEITKTGEGWLLNGDILVSWDATNSPVNVAQTHVVSGGSTVEADEDKEAREITFSFSGVSSLDVKLPNGTTTELQEVEAKFLTSVALILGRGTPGLYDDALETVIEQSNIVGFTDTKSGLHHGHSESKHRIQHLGVTEKCADMLWSNANDHTPLHEMALREQELKNAPIDVFEDAPNDDPSKWRKIHSTREKAPIPKNIHTQLEEQFE